jgi:phosphatidylserine/phosphatidylglycerophosphate/cardiolipin synthase-like enzyme
MSDPVTVAEVDRVASTSLGFAAYFSPQDDVPSVILAHARMAQKSLVMKMYGFTLEPLLEVFIAKKQAGIAVQLLLDHTQAEGHAEKPIVDKAIAAGLDVVIGTSCQRAILHNKYLIIDGAVVISGSFNFSVTAEKEGNCLYVFRWPDLAKRHLDDFTAARQWVLQHEPQYQPKR